MFPGVISRSLLKQIRFKLKSQSPRYQVIKVTFLFGTLGSEQVIVVRFPSWFFPQGPKRQWVTSASPYMAQYALQHRYPWSCEIDTMPILPLEVWIWMSHLAMQLRLLLESHGKCTTWDASAEVGASFPLDCSSALVDIADISEVPGAVQCFDPFDPGSIASFGLALTMQLPTSMRMSRDRFNQRPDCVLIGFAGYPNKEIRWNLVDTECESSQSVKLIAFYISYILTYEAALPGQLLSCRSHSSISLPQHFCWSEDCTFSVGLRALLAFKLLAFKVFLLFSKSIFVPFVVRICWDYQGVGGGGDADRAFAQPRPKGMRS